jgi:UDP-glucose 4-epimerase
MARDSSLEVHILTGGAGFIGSNLAYALLNKGVGVLVLDDLSRGVMNNLRRVVDHPRFRFAKVNCTSFEEIEAAVEANGDLGAPSEVWHLAANSDIPAGVVDPSVDLNATFMTTFSILQWMERAGVKLLNFASSAAVYGDMGDIEIGEDSSPLEPISNYGAMKLASEALIRAAVERSLDRANVFRFPNVVGAPATHGVIFDFVNKLLANPRRLDVLGDGRQRKPYLHSDTLIEAMLYVRGAAPSRFNVVNIGPLDDGIEVRQIAEIVARIVGGDPTIAFGDENRGWVGDVPRFRYSTRRLQALGWRTDSTSEEAIVRAATEIIAERRGWTSSAD